MHTHLTSACEEKVPQEKALNERVMYQTTDGTYPVASTKKHQQLALDPWVSAASLLAGAAGDVHDIGKASVHFQHKLSLEQAGNPKRDQVRHEWLSMKLLQKMRHNGWNWFEAWQGIDRKIHQLSLGDREQVKKQSLANALEAVDYLVVSHHGLLGDKNGYPNADLHVRVQGTIATEQISCAGELDDSIFKTHQQRMARLERLQPSDAQDQRVYWKALASHARAALIHADHTVSAQHFSETKPETAQLFANTKEEFDAQGKRSKIQNQPLQWHLEQVGDRASHIAVKMATDLNLTGLREQTLKFICRPAQQVRFQWQNVVANALQKQVSKHPDIPSLILNIAGTGSGKTRMNLRAACTLRPEDPRISIALNLRSLTLQTGEALKSSMHLGDDELAVIIGDQVSQQLFNQRSEHYVDEDENQVEPSFDAMGENNVLPTWLQPLFEKTFKGHKVLDRQAQSVLSSPLLVSTIDYLIAAGEPHRQGHHVKALLRIISSDLILDEIDGYEPKALIAVLRLVQLAAMYGRNVICSSATLSSTVANTLYRAFESGIEMRQSLIAAPQKFLVAIADNELKPKLWIQNDQKCLDFAEQYQQHLIALQAVLAEKAKQPFRLAKLAEISEPSVANWKKTVLAEVEHLHRQHAWGFGGADKDAVGENDTEKKISFGLVRVANIKHAIGLAKYLSEHLPYAQIACYHANDWLISRFHKEQRLDFLLSRHKDNKKRKTGNEHILQDEEIIGIVQHSDGADIPFIVIATPVEEVGRDHDFDWAVIDASSIQSIVQTAGRVNRHRLTPVREANIVIPQFNYRYCQNQDQADGKKRAAFKWPGYEAYQSSSKENCYSSQDVKDLITWQDGRVVIDARLRFDTEDCKFAFEDDAQIKKFCKNYFYMDGPAYFSNSQVDACLLTEAIYTQTPLREIQKQKVYTFDYTDELRVTHLPDGHLKYDPATKRYQQAKDSVLFLSEPVPDNAWLSLHPKQLIELCISKAVKVEDGCKVSLPVYSDESPQWTYHYGFGLYRA